MSGPSIDILITVLLILASGFFSGITIALTSLSDDVLRLISQIGGKGDSDYTQNDAVCASKILEFTTNRTRLIVTLLIGNTAVNSALSIFLGSTVGEGFIAGITATSLIVVFGEIGPAILLTKYALPVGARVSGIMKIIMIVLTPVSGPIVFVLNKFVSEESIRKFSRTEIIYQVKEMEKDNDSNVDSFDMSLIEGSLSLHKTSINKIMTPRNEVFRLEKDDVFDEDLINRIRESGFTRIPVFVDYETDNIFGVMNVKQLTGIKPIGQSVADFTNTKHTLFLEPDTMADDAIYKMIESKTHLCFVWNGNFWEGIVSLEDITEQIFGRDIEDEFDDDEHENLEDQTLHSPLLIKVPSKETE